MKGSARALLARAFNKRGRRAWCSPPKWPSASASRGRRRRQRHLRQSYTAHHPRPSTWPTGRRTFPRAALALFAEAVFETSDSEVTAASAVVGNRRHSIATLYLATDPATAACISVQIELLDDVGLSGDRGPDSGRRDPVDASERSAAAIEGRRGARPPSRAGAVAQTRPPATRRRAGTVVAHTARDRMLLEHG
eukprot:scaffold28590_cov62-Phaeocystis_antarctica.AAC.3